MVKQEPKDVYFVWTKTGRRPTRVHADVESACNEAARLAGMFPSKKFLVLHAIYKFSAVPQQAADATASTVVTIPAPRFTVQPVELDALQTALRVKREANR